MSDTFGIDAGMDAAKHRVCRVAYTLNNEQPVICTIIGEQPLFYMDYDYEDEEEALFDAAELSILEAELQNLQKEVESFERFTSHFADVDEVFERFEVNEEQVCQGKKSQKGSIEDVLTILQQSRLAQAYLDMAKEHNVDLILCSQTAEGEYDRTSGHILINNQLDLVDQVLIAARELRRHWQHRQGALIHPMMFHPDNAVLVNRVQMADLTTSMIRIAWELQLSDYKEAWRRIENSSMEDLGRAFAREAFLDFRTINNGQASAAVFEAWFLSERCRVEDRKLIQKMLADYQGYVFDMDESEKAITPALIAAIGEMPFGKNYLSAHVNTIMGDAIFTDVRDRSNANFLWFIKFEKSFRETEQELQRLESNQAAEDIAQAAFLKENHKNKETGTYNDELHGSDAKVIQLYSELKPSEHKKQGTKGKGADIIYLR